MNILLILPIPPAKWQVPRYQQGVGSISAVLKEAGHDTRLLRLDHADREAVRDTLTEFPADLVGVSVTSNYFDLASELSAFIASEFKIPIVLGGIHPTLRPDECIAAEGVFAVCVGEGEYPMVELCEALAHGGDPTRIGNLWVKTGDTVHRNGLRPLIRDLDALPFPDRELFDFDALLGVLAEAEFMGSRGCPFKCTYCANHALAQLYRGKGPYVRYRSVDNLLDEITAVTGRYEHIAFLGFHDDTFTLRKSWLKEFSEKYPARFSHPFWCNSTADAIDEEVAGLLKQAGCHEVRIGVESGNDHIRMNVLEKKVTREDIVQAFRTLRDVGIETYSFNMIGLPYETRETIEDTIRLNQLIRPNHAFCSVFFPYPGTRAYEICKENDWISGRNVESYFAGGYALDQPTLTRKDVDYYHDLFRDLVRWPRFDRLIRCMHKIPVVPHKSLWNLCRRVRAKSRETWAAIRGKPLLPE